MCPEQPRVEPDAPNPLGDEPGILAGGHTAVCATMAGEQELARPFAGGLQIIINGLAGLIAQFEPDRPSSFLLPDGSAIRRIPAGGDILDPDGDDVAATKLAVDCEIEHGEVASAALDLKLCPDGPDVFWSQRRLCPR